MTFQAPSRVIANQKLGEDCFKLRLFCPQVARACRAGHFIHIQVNSFPYPLLRRPMSIYKSDGKKTIEVVFRVIGVGTGLLSQKTEGEELEILGPLGNQFTPLAAGEIAVMAAGGLGIVPVYYYALELEKQKLEKQVYFVYGAKNKSELYCREDTEKLKSKVRYSTDDGSHGFKGYLTQLLDQLIAKEKLDKNKIRIFGCGPDPMLESLSKYSKQNNLFCELSLEVGMPCGMGTCMGCVVKCADGQAGEVTFKRVCVDGPIFRVPEVIFG